MKKSYLILFLIIFAGALLRLYQLGDVPRGVTHDELGYVYNSYSLATSGRNLLGQPHPFLSYIYGGGFPFMPVTTYLSVIFFKFLPLSAFSGRLPNALLGTISIYLVYLLTKYLFRKESIAILAAGSLAVMPWHIFWSRTAYDVPVAAFFYLAAVTLFMYEVNHRRLPIFSPVLFLAALLSYRGMAPVAPALMALCFWYARRYLKTPPKSLRVFAAGAVFAAGIFAGTAYANRTHGFMSEAGIDFSKIAWDIELTRRETTGPEKIKQIFINKPMYLLNYYAPNYLNAFSPGHLFLHGEANQIYTMPMRGKLYLVDAVLILSGIYFLLKKRQARGAEMFVFGLVLAGALPCVLLGEPYASRGMFMAVGMAILVAVAIDGLVRIKNIGGIVGIILCAVYLYSGAHFIYDYFFRYTYQRSDVWVADMKEVTRRIRETPGKGKTMIAGAGFVDVMEYAFYTKTDPVKVQSAWKNQNELANIRFKLDSVDFIQACAKLSAFDLLPEVADYRLIISRPECFNKEIPADVIRDYYRNPVWKIFLPK